MKAKVAYTYGWTDAYIESMPHPVFLDYWKAITPIEAEEQLRGFEICSVPHMKKPDRKELVGKYRRLMKSMIDRSGGKLASVKDLAKAFARMRMDG
jgi:hypothetical protein